MRMVYKIQTKGIIYFQSMFEMPENKILWFYSNDSTDLFHPRNLLQSFVGVHQLGLGLEEPVDVLVH